MPLERQAGVGIVDVIERFQSAVGADGDAVGAQAVASAAQQGSLGDQPRAGERIVRLR